MKRRGGLRKICTHPDRLWGKDACLPCPWYGNVYVNGKSYKKNLNRLFKVENLSRTEAKARYRQFCTMAEAGQLDPAQPAVEAAASLTLRDYAREWLAACPLRVKPTTVEFYTGNVDRYLLPAIGDRPIADIERDDVSALVAKLDAQGLKRTSIRGVLRTLSALLTTAEASPKRTKVTSNPARKTKDLIAQAGKPKDDPDPFSTEEANRLLDHAFPRFSGKAPTRVRTDFWYAFLLCGLRTGMRLGELLGLEWGDVDWTGRTITVSRNFTHGALTTPKNGKSRTVDLSAELATALEAFRRQLAAEFLLYGMPLPDPAFPSAEGGRLDAANVRRALRSICQKAKLRQRSPHDLRHTFASQMLNLGAPITEVSQQLGHSSVAITLSTYAKWLPRPDGRRSVDLLGRKADGFAKNLPESPLSLASAK